MVKTEKEVISGGWLVTDRIAPRSEFRAATGRCGALAVLEASCAA